MIRYAKMERHKEDFMLRKSEIYQGAFMSRGQGESLPWVLTRIAESHIEARTIDGATATVFRSNDPLLEAVSASNAEKSFARLMARYYRMRRQSQTAEGRELAEVMLSSIRNVKASLKSGHFEPLS